METESSLVTNTAGIVLQGCGAYSKTETLNQTVRGLGWYLGVGGAKLEYQSSYLACCLQRGLWGQWTTQLEELLDKLKKESKQKRDIAVEHKTCNVR